MDGHRDSRKVFSRRPDAKKSPGRKDAFEAELAAGRHALRVVHVTGPVFPTLILTCRPPGVEKPIDLDREADCAPPLCEAWLPAPAPHLCFRVAVRAIEAWLMADAETLVSFLGVARSRVPRDPENVAHPKQAMVELARRSRRRAIREDMVPREGSGRQVGPAYSSRLMEYAGSRWRPEVAAQHSASLQRAIACLEILIGARP